MPRRRWALLLACALSAAIPAGADEPLQAGTASLDLTPPRRVPLAGFSRRGGKPSAGVHDAPRVRALVLRQGSRLAAVASCDLLMIDETLFAAVRRRLHEAGFDDSAVLLISATHTHSGPGAYGRRYVEQLSMGHYDPAVFDFLSSRIAQAIQLAAGQVRPATVAASSGPTRGLVVNRMHSGGPADETLRVVGVWTQGRQAPAAVIANFSAHPTTLGAWNRQLSADYPGVLARQVEARYPGAVCLFTAGAVGDQAPIKTGAEFEPAERLGFALAQQVIAQLDTLRPAAGALSARFEVMALPPPCVRLGRVALPSWMSRWFVDDDASLAMVSAGPALLIGVPCDMTAELGRRLQAHAQARGFEPLVVGFANDYIGYCLPPERYHEQAYEAMMAFNGPEAGQRIVERLTRMIDEVPNP